MPSGHTDKATIGARRPLSPRMVEMLGRLRRERMLNWGNLENAERNTMRALIDRGLATDTYGVCRPTSDETHIS